VVIEVNDSGIGIEPEALPRVFNAFEQVEQSITRQFDGLGLAICKTLAEFPASLAKTTSNDPDGIARAVELLRKRPVARIVVEATGGYEVPFVVALREARLPVALVNPHQVREYARAMGILAKTDRIDAGVLARFRSCEGPIQSPNNAGRSLYLRNRVSWSRQPGPLHAVRPAAGDRPDSRPTRP
jgi:hypothetical protein